MTGNYFMLAVAAAALPLSAACVTKASTANCSVTGAKYLGAKMSAEEICGTFDRRLDNVLAAGGHAGMADNLQVVIELTELGSATAQISGEGQAAGEPYPVVAVDVMDRAFVADDLDRLADAVAQMLMN